MSMMHDLYWLLERAAKAGLVVTIETEAQRPLAMRNYRMSATIRGDVVQPKPVAAVATGGCAPAVIINGDVVCGPDDGIGFIASTGDGGVCQ
jgi:hypothetical protein